MFGLLSIAMIQVNVFLWLKYVLKREDLGNAVIFCVQGIGLACFPLWSYIAKKVGKKRAFYMVRPCAAFWSTAPWIRLRPCRARESV